jgi:hypothetical protein
VVGKKEENDTGFTVVRPIGAYVHLVFSYSLLAIFTIEWRDLYIGYMEIGRGVNK